MELEQIIAFFPIPSPVQILQLTGGANNRVFKLVFRDHPPLILKQYFQDASDQRPRLHSEYSFLQYAWKIGLRNVPEPQFASREANAAIYSFISARPVQPEDITEELVQQKISFFLRLNEKKKEAESLPRASEACFFSEQYLDVTEQRISRLDQIDPGLPLQEELKAFVVNEMSPKWKQLQAKCKAALQRFSEKELGIENQCISPSDFGFHNALICDNQLTFIDFEFAGWDDPCKTVCDLFCQPRIPLPFVYFPKVMNAFSHSIEDVQGFFQRVELLLPVIQMKWCCIILNAFTRIGQNRRLFSHSDEIKNLEKQLLLAKQKLVQIQI